MTALAAGFHGSTVRRGVSSPTSRLSRLLHRHHADAQTLASVRVGQCAVLGAVASDVPAATARRLLDLGFVPGARVEVLRRAPMADPIVFRVADTEIALRRAQARSLSLASLDAR